MGPSLPFSDQLHATKYRGRGEDYREFANRLCGVLTDDKDSFYALRDIVGDMRFLFGGRIQSATGSHRNTTSANCYVSGTFRDSLSGPNGITARFDEAMRTMQMGGGIGYDFSTLRPRGTLIAKHDTSSSGPVSFMDIFDAGCGTIASAGHRRGAQMGCLRVDHPDIEEFVRAKMNNTRLRNFNISVLCTDDFMRAVRDKRDFQLQFEGKNYAKIDAAALWDLLMRANYDWAEPGVLFVDRINRENNLHYCEYISATNPCAEQPLPPYGACILGSWNLTRYIRLAEGHGSGYEFAWDMFRHDIPYVVAAMDRVIDTSRWPLEQQEDEAKRKRRMGIGVTGVANAIEALGHPYGSEGFLATFEDILRVLRDTTYTSSVSLAIERGAFPLFSTQLVESGFAKTLPEDIVDKIIQHGIRNSHLLSIAPTGTISMVADNVSSGIEPPYNLGYVRDIKSTDDRGFEVTSKIEMIDYAKRVWGIKGKTAQNDVTLDDHLNVLGLAARYVDSAVSKTINLPTSISFEAFKGVYMRAYDLGVKGCTTYRAGCKRDTIFTIEEDEVTGGVDGTACYFDAETGTKSCDA